MYQPLATTNGLVESDGILGAIGGTPLVRLSRLYEGCPFRLHAKLEALNPGGSAKDRPAKRMVEDALQQGVLRPGGVVIESSSGNLGVGLAQVCRYHNLRFICVVDEKAQPMNLAIIRAFGGEVQIVNKPPDGDYLAARIRRVCQLLEQTENSYWPNQYANALNRAAHAETTAREIDDALAGEVDWLFVATSSTGTLSGCQHYFSERHRRTQIVAVDAVGSVLFGGVQGERLFPGMGASREPPLSRGVYPCRVIRVSDVDCVRGCRRLAKHEAVLAGASGGGVVEAVARLATNLYGEVVVVLHDSGMRYLDTVYDDHWVEATLGSHALEESEAAAWSCGTREAVA